MGRGQNRPQGLCLLPCAAQWQARSGWEGLALLLVRCVVRVYCEQVAHSPARWPSWGFSSGPGTNGRQ